jgi:hypothetical protein
MAVISASVNTIIPISVVIVIIILYFAIKSKNKSQKQQKDTQPNNINVNEDTKLPYLTKASFTRRYQRLLEARQSFAQKLELRNLFT